ncbi:hypothetical protein ACHAWO_001013 [Cyclotella atomus]|uniref:Uncharacterized protein n=1 Tax=Cyclotella atomus TaxID=382360 RepID=A0ABD3QAY3_9STRA
MLPTPAPLGYGFGVSRGHVMFLHRNLYKHLGASNAPTLLEIDDGTKFCGSDYWHVRNTYLLLCLHNCDETDSFMCRIGLDKIAHLESAAQDSVYWLDKRVNTIPCPSMLRW